MYPASIITIPTANGATSLGANTHSVLHNTMGTVLLALENKVGVDSSAVVTSIDYLLKSPSSISPGHKHSGSDLVAGTLNTLLPSQTGQGGKFLQSDGTNTSWQTAGGGGGSGITRTITNVTTSITAGASLVTDYVYLCGTNGNVQLPTALANTNQYYIERTGTTTVAITSTGGELFNGVAGPINLILTGTSIILYSDNTGWRY